MHLPAGDYFSLENINSREGTLSYGGFLVFLFQSGNWNTIFSKGQEGGTGSGNLSK